MDDLKTLIKIDKDVPDNFLPNWRRKINMPHGVRDKLTPLQMRFAQEYIKTSNVTESARIAGVKSPEKNGHAILYKPQVKKYIKYMTDKIEQTEIVNVAWKLLKLKEVVQGCLEGKADKERLIHPNGAINAIAEMNKMQGDYAAIKTEEKKTIDIVGFQELMLECQREF